MLQLPPPSATLRSVCRPRDSYKPLEVGYKGRQGRNGAFGAQGAQECLRNRALGALPQRSDSADHPTTRLCGDLEIEQAGCHRSVRAVH